VGKKASSDGSVMTSHTCDGRYRAWQALEDKYWLQFGMGLHNSNRSIPGWARWETQVGKVDNHPHLLAHVILTTPPSKATSPGKVVPLKSHLAH